MKYPKILLLFLLFFPLISFAQSDTTGIRELYKKMFEEINQGDFTSVFDHMYPKLYDVIPRDIMEKGMSEALNSTDVEMKIYDNVIEDVSFLAELEGIKFVKISYSATMSMKLLGEEESEDSGFDSKALMLVSLNQQFGSDNVSYNEDGRKYIIETHKWSLAIKDPEFGVDWKVINVEPAQKPILEKFIPEKILNFFN